MLKRRRSRTVAALMTVMAVGLSGCGTSGDGAAEDTLTIWDFSVEQTGFHDKVVAQYAKEHPGTKVEWRSISQDEYQQTLPLAFQSHQGPDIFYWSSGGPSNMAQLLDQKWIRPLTSDGKVSKDFTSRWPEGSFVEGINTYQGKTYGFPFSENLYWGPGYMFLNNKVFEDAGLDTANPPRTWSELKDSCARIEAKTDAYCIASPSKEQELQRIWFALASGASTDLFFNFHEGKFSLDDPQALKTFSYIQELQKAGYLAPGLNDKNFSRQQFAVGQAGIYLDGTWVPSVWNSQGFTGDKYTVAAHPVPDGGATGALARQHDGNKYWVSSQTKKAEAASEFLQWMTEPDGYFAKEYLKTGFGTLAFADSAKQVTDPAVKQIMKIADQPGYRVNVPVPVQKCPDLVKSTAYLDAISKRPNWEYEAMVEALTSGKPLAPEAKKLVAERQKTLEDGLKKEAASGLKVSIDCYTFPDWKYTEDYSPKQ
ncbi:ABC transporter substrate-binding protein [Streptomyces sp. NPDC088147]|uniref:ABC transporter substrate-binding protein n=1 Tax=unclassified Streptomyces TaxID=2593676 RepID=UPI0033B7934C